MRFGRIGDDEIVFRQTVGRAGGSAPVDAVEIVRANVSLLPAAIMVP